jgi:hypothetical protein
MQPLRLNPHDGTLIVGREPAICMAVVLHQKFALESIRLHSGRAKRLLAAYWALPRGGFPDFNLGRAHS